MNNYDNNYMCLVISYIGLDYHLLKKMKNP